eukprot:m.266077 g.266077  ORF g.266077 m.266077 type:complete len:51 (+) comp26763_c4_seq1:1956-2108(+)
MMPHSTNTKQPSRHTQQNTIHRPLSTLPQSPTTFVHTTELNESHTTPQGR